MPAKRNSTLSTLVRLTPSNRTVRPRIVPTQGHAMTETMHATPWKEFLANL